jgi:hypothetical protein
MFMFLIGGVYEGRRSDGLRWYMKCAIGMIHVPCFIKIGSGIQMSIGEIHSKAVS